MRTTKLSIIPGPQMTHKNQTLHYHRQVLSSNLWFYQFTNFTNPVLLLGPQFIHSFNHSQMPLYWIVTSCFSILLHFAPALVWQLLDLVLLISSHIALKKLLNCWSIQHLQRVIVLLFIYQLCSIILLSIKVYANYTFIKEFWQMCSRTHAGLW